MKENQKANGLIVEVVSGTANLENEWFFLRPMAMRLLHGMCSVRFICTIKVSFHVEQSIHYGTRVDFHRNSMAFSACVSVQRFL